MTEAQTKTAVMDVAAWLAAVVAERHDEARRLLALFAEESEFHRGTGRVWPVSGAVITPMTAAIRATLFPQALPTPQG